MIYAQGPPSPMSPCTQVDPAHQIHNTGQVAPCFVHPATMNVDARNHEAAYLAHQQNLQAQAQSVPVVDLSDEPDLSTGGGNQNQDRFANRHQQMLPAMQMIHGVHPSQQQPVFRVPPGMQVIPIQMQQMQ